MINVVLGKKSFISSSIKEIFIKKKISSIFYGKDDINFLNNKSIKNFKKKITRLKKFNLIIISAIVPAKNVKDYAKNIIIIKNIISSLDQKKINKIIYVSSDAVYADTKKEISETSKTDPTSIHGLMHLNREKLLSLYYAQKLIIVRSTLLFGSKDPHNSYGPNSFIRLAKNKKNIILFGNGEEKRDHLFVGDFAFIIYCLLINKNIKKGIFNAASGKVISFYDIAKLVKKKYKLIKICKTKRTSPMPHFGLRKLNNARIRNVIKKLCFKNISDVIESY
jgi:UDP-glucose 4-epimerase